MESKLEDFNKIFAHRVSPYQSYMNAIGKNDVINSWKYQIWQIWLIPLTLTFTELICLKHSNLRAANSVALFKYASILLGVGLTQHYYTKLKHKLEYYDALFPHAPKAQLELTRDIMMAKQRHN